MNGWKTLLGAGIALVATILQTQGILVDVEGVTNAGIAIGGLALAIYGRLVANKPGPLAVREAP